MKAALPPNEAQRLEALRGYNVLDTPTEVDFDDLTLFAAQIFQVPIAVITLVDENRQWFKSILGLDATETPRDLAFCAHAILNPDEVLEVRDAQLDPRFADNPLVTADPSIRFYAGAPLVTHDGFALGTLCVIDRVPRVLTAEQRAALRALSRSVITQLELRRSLAEHRKAEEQLQSLNMTLEQKVEERTADLNREMESRLKSNQGLRKAQEIGHIGSWEWDVRDDTAFWSDETYRLFGIDKNDLGEHRKSFLDLILPEDRSMVDSALSNALKGIREYDIQYRARLADGTIKHIHALAEVIRDGEGKPIVMQGTVQDITVLKKIQETLEAALEYSNNLFRSMQDGFAVLDKNSCILDSNPAFCRMTGFSLEELLGSSPPFPYWPPEEYENIQAAFQKTLRDEISNYELIFMRKGGERFPVFVSPSVVKDKMGNVVSYTATVKDITERKIAAAKIEHLAYHDQLTRLPNRLLLADRLKQASVSSARSGRENSLLFIDLDNFKNLNDTLGHDVGDMLLSDVAHRLESCVREGDTVARLGGDEFMVMLVDLGGQLIEAAAQTESIGEKILAAISQPYLLGKHVHRCTASIGVTLFKGSQRSTDELMKQADIAMYQAKKAGRNALRFFDHKMQESISARVSLEGELQNALEFQQLQLHYQIQVDSSLRPSGAEALIRWRHPLHGLILPAQFILLAEESGLILPIGQWVIETACAQLKVWENSELTRDLTLAVNVSPKQFRQEGFVAQVQAAVQGHAIKPMLLKLEITEGLLLEDIEGTIVTMRALNEIGVHFSLDDFGTGYSSLQYLKRLPLDQLKIDQSFVRDIVTDDSDRAIVRTIIAMAKSLDMTVIAEGVETKEQQLLLMNIGCTLYQGYLFGRPVPIEQLDAILKQR